MSKIIIAPIIFSSRFTETCKRRREQGAKKYQMQERKKWTVGEKRHALREATATNCKEMENIIIMIDRLSCEDRKRVVNMYST